MTDLTQYLNPTRAAIDDYVGAMYGYESQGITITLGDSCDRRSWLKTQGKAPSAPSSKDLMFFQIMDDHKKRMIDYLEGMGCNVWDKKKRLSISNGKASSVIDGLVQGVLEAPGKVHLLMICPQKEKSYKKGMSDKHHVKMQTDMRLLGIDRCLFIRIDMNSGSFELSREKLDAKFADAQLMKADRIVNARHAPERVGTGLPSWYECKACKLKDVCFND